MLTVYAQKVYADNKKDYEVRIFRDEKLEYHIATFTIWNSNKPTYRNKYVTLNCTINKIQWIK